MEKKDALPTLPKPSRHSFPDSITTSVLGFSYFLKQMGYDQKLEYGDLYVVNLGIKGQPSFKAYIYSVSENSQMSPEESEFLSSNKYIRIPQVEELIEYMSQLGIVFNIDEGPVRTEDGWSLSLIAPDNGVKLSFYASSLHECFLKAIFFFASALQNQNNFGLEVKNNPSLMTPSGEDLEEEEETLNDSINNFIAGLNKSDESVATGTIEITPTSSKDTPKDTKEPKDYKTKKHKKSDKSEEKPDSDKSENKSDKKEDENETT